MGSFPPVDATSPLSLSVTWRIPFVPAYRGRVRLNLFSAFMFTISLTSIEKHLVTHVLGMVC